MKLIFWLTLFALSWYAMAYYYTADKLLNEPNFFSRPGTWSFNESNYGPDFRGACVPTGEIQMFSDPNNASQAYLKSTQWSGTVCSQLGINQNYNLNLPFFANSTFSNISAQGWKFNNVHIEMEIYGLSVYNLSSGGQVAIITFGFDFNYANITGGSLCYFTLQQYLAPPVITQATPSLLSAIWYSNTTTPADLSNSACCIPIGEIHIFTDMSDAAQMFMIASQWEGALCSNFFIDSYFMMRIPFVNVSSYADLLVQGLYKPHNNLNVTFSVSGFDNKNSTTENVLIDLQFDYSSTQFAGDVCSVTITRSDDDFLLDSERTIVDSILS